MPTEPASWAEDKPVARLARAYLAATRQASIHAGFDLLPEYRPDIKLEQTQDIFLPQLTERDEKDNKSISPAFPRLNTNPGDPRLKRMAKELSKYLKVDSDTAARLSLVYHCCSQEAFTKFLRILSGLRTGLPIQVLVINRWRKGHLLLSMSNGPLDLQIKAGRLFPTTQCIPVLRLSDAEVVDQTTLRLKFDHSQTELKFCSTTEPYEVLDIINLILGKGNPLYDLNREDANVFCPTTVVTALS